MGCLSLSLVPARTRHSLGPSLLQVPEEATFVSRWILEQLIGLDCSCSGGCGMRRAVGVGVCVRVCVGARTRVPVSSSGSSCVVSHAELVPPSKGWGAGSCPPRLTSLGFAAAGEAGLCDGLRPPRVFPQRTPGALVIRKHADFQPAANLSTSCQTVYRIPGSNRMNVSAAKVGGRLALAS